MSDDPDQETEPLSDQQLRDRTSALLRSAERVSLQLSMQTEKLAAAIDMFDREIITPLRKGLGHDE
jgi:hypothetical protein